MKGHSLLAASLIAFLLAMAAPARGAYWFQSGAKGNYNSAQNGGASVSIQTISQPQVSSGAMAFWVGENMPNKTFLQVGYLIQNQTGVYPVNCNASGCSGTEYLAAGDAEWFYEYFLPTENSSFMGEIGPDGSAGKNGTVNNYAFYSSGNTWYILFNGKQIGSVNLGESSSGPYWPVALGEVADTSTNKAQMSSVTFSNLSIYKNGAFSLIPYGYGVISYGVGSQTQLANLYGVGEIGSRTNYFAVGSGLPLNANNTQLWKLGYTVSVVSPYGNLSSKNGYAAYTAVGLSAPATVYLNGTSRVSFTSWSGSGVGAYTGTQRNVSVTLDGNITEKANWQQQYLFNVSTLLSYPSGTGWYGVGSLVNYGVANASVYENETDRYVFSSWSNGNRNQTGTALIKGPLNITASWLHQYFVNATPAATTTGSGWYNQGSYANLSVPAPIVNLSSGKRVAFISWSNGNESSTMHERVTSPVSLRAQFSTQYLIGLSGKDSQGRSISVSNFTINGVQRAGGSAFLNANQTYVLNGVYYKGVFLPVNLSVPTTAPSAFSFSLPVYDVKLNTVDLFGLPVNASVSMVFGNGSASKAYSGASGALLVPDVPYGSANVTASLFGITERTSTSGGKGASLVFVSMTNLVGFAAIALAICILAAARMRRRPPVNPAANPMAPAQPSVPTPAS
jgi:hypothetical protein